MFTIRNQARLSPTDYNNWRKHFDSLTMLHLVLVPPAHFCWTAVLDKLVIPYIFKALSMPVCDVVPE